jgi:Protein of unknown function (DUF4238)
LKVDPHKKSDENQHYVPRLLLKNFSVPLKRDQLMAFDKQAEKTFLANITKISSEKGFYDIEVGDLIHSMEGSLQENRGCHNKDNQIRH